MAVKLGSSAVTLRLGAATYPTKAYLGDTLVAATVPSAPTITSAVEVGGTDTELAWQAPATNGGSSITEYKFYADGSEQTPSPQADFVVYLTGITSGAVVEVSAVNAVGEGPKSAPVTVT